VLAVAVALGLTLAAAAARQATITVDAPAWLDPVARRIRNLDQAALARSLAAAGLELPSRMAVTLVPDDDPRARGVPRWVVGLASGTSRVVIFPDRIGPYPYDSLETVTRHEAVHLALNARAAGRPLPRWFHEGVAVTLESGWGTRDEMRLLLAAFDPPSLAEIGRLFASDSQPDTAQAYLLSGALVHEIQRRHGPGAIGAVAARVAGGAEFGEAFHSATGETLDAAAARAWRGHRRLSRWVPVLTSPSAVWAAILALAAVAFAFRVRRRRELRRRWDAEESLEPESAPDSSPDA
jgi:MYXO-CTERM domain-containing protein